MITLYLLGDTSQPMPIEHGLVIGKNWNIRDGKGAIYTSTPNEGKAREVFARLLKSYPNTAWTLKFDI